MPAGRSHWLRFLGNPLVALPIWAVNLYLWHLSALYDGVLDSPLLHLAQHAGFFTFGLAMWLPLVGPLPKPAWFGDGAKLVYVIVVRLLEAVLANVLIWSGTVLYPDYAPGEAKWNISAAGRPGRGGQRDDDLDRNRDPRLCSPGSSSARPAAAPRSRSSSTSRTPTESTSTRAAPRGRWPGGPGRAASRAHPHRRNREATRFLYVLVFVVGTASLGTEIAVARLMAPFFGASTIVWANTIGVVLVALSIGYWLGGRMADRRPDLRSLCLAVLAAAVLLALVPLVSQPFFDPSIDALDQIEAGAFVGSLLAVLLLVSVPVVLLGMCSPWALRLAVTDVEHAGRISGRLYAISTVGSLTGTMLAALVLIPFAGTHRTFLVFSLALALVAVVGLSRRWVLVPLALAGSLALPVGTVKATDDGRVLFEGESEQQYIRVVEQTDGDTVLELNEGQAVHSVLPSRGFLTADYWDSFVELPFAAADRPPKRVAILGNAGGTIARQYGHFWPRAKVDGVELDPELTDIGYRYFDMGSNPNLTVYNDDARPWLRQADGRYDMIVVDAYRQPYIPFYLTTKEFFELARDHLAPGGIVVVNVGHAAGNQEFERVIGATMASVFPTVLRDPVEDFNSLMIGSEAPASAQRLAGATRARAFTATCASWR